MTETSFQFSRFIAIGIAWLSLAGIVSDFVVWKTWFETGLFEYYKVFTGLVNEVLIKVIGAEVPIFLISLFLLAMISVRSKFLILSRDGDEDVAVREIYGILVWSFISAPIISTVVLISGGPFPIVPMFFSILLGNMLMMSTAVPIFQMTMEMIDSIVDGRPLKEYADLQSTSVLKEFCIQLAFGLVLVVISVDVVNKI
ncbi:hypothetical protein [Dinoroseobacter sp. S76]|uniref:hypothetical protein n=1 Tax=Dinoroseobacter sp. S76 TaxID=3415124 RepID=UPI003C7E916E